MDYIMKLINEAFESLQYIKIQPTVENVAMFYKAFADLQNAYNLLREKAEAEKKEEEKPEEN